MGFSEYFELEKSVKLEVDSKTYSSVVKKIKEDLIALLLSPPPAKAEDVPQDKLTKVIVEKNGAPFVIQSKVASNKTFPIVVVKLEKMAQAETERTAVEDIVKGYKDKELHNNTYVAARESARIEDSFPMEFYPQPKEEAEQKKKDYLLRRTKDRRESAVSTGIYAGYNEAEILEKISYMDKALVEVILDIYKKIAAVTTTVTQAKPKMEGENIGMCVDLSGTGLKLICTQKLNKGDVLKLIIAPPKALPPFSISALGEVMRVEEVSPQPKQPKKYATGIKYYAMHEDDMELITQYTFQLQREMLSMRRREKMLEQ